MIGTTWEKVPMIFAVTTVGSAIDGTTLGKVYNQIKWCNVAKGWTCALREQIGGVTRKG